MTAALLVTVLLISTCGLVYELVAGALASYLLGDSVTQFSTIIGAYLFAMGIGAGLSRYVGRGLEFRFVVVELMVGLVGGLSSAALFLAFGWTEHFRLVLYLLVVAIGTLVGLEIPLLMRILRRRFDFKDVVAHVLTFDYLGALVASVAFPLVLVPFVGLVRTAMLFGVLNTAVALWTTWLFRDTLRRVAALRVAGAIVLATLGTGMVVADRVLDLAEDNLYADEVILSRTTPYQRIVVTAWKDDVRLFLNSHLQFSSRDEYRYHEALVHPGLAAAADARRVLVLGGGDGLAVREVLRYPAVTSVTLVDLDPEMPRLFTTHTALSALNEQAFRDPRVHLVQADAFVWLESTTDTFDFAIVDFPDPSSFSLGKLYTTTFYRLLGRHLAPGARFVVQSTSPLFARQSFWCVVRTLEAVGFEATPYHVYVPSFGEWGFVLAGHGAYSTPTGLPQGLRYLTTETLPAMLQFPPDMQAVDVEPNRLNNQALVRYYEHEWTTINR
ncbi:MAG: polyamine aminopropyltransferase [Vicinamibacterales bacterium]